MNRLPRLTLPEWSIHALIWALLIGKDVVDMYGSPTYPVPKTAVATYWALAIGYTSVSAGAFYGSLRFVASPLLRGPVRIRSLGWAALGLLLTFGSIIGWRYWLEMQVFKPLLKFDNYRANETFTLAWFVGNSVWYYLDYVIYGLLYAFIKRHLVQEKRQRESEQARTAAELAFLRSQLNPHFLFNTINDIYALVYAKSDQAPDALLQLSALLRYVLHEGRVDQVPLAKELAYVRGLIDLQQLGAKNTLQIDYQLRGSLGGQQIAPLLLVSFVENAFKHGLTNDPHYPIRLWVTLTPSTLEFQLANRKSHHQKDPTSGIGLVNVRRRLDLLYPGQHRLVIADQMDDYQVTLHLTL